MKKTILILLCTLSFSVVLFGQSGSINNTLGSGGTFRVTVSGNDSLLIVNDDGNVGIGTTMPGSKLEVAGDIKANNLLSVETFSSYLNDTWTGSQDERLLKYTTVTQNTNANVFDLNASTGELTFKKAGSVSIGASLYSNFTGGIHQIIIKINGTMQSWFYHGGTVTTTHSATTLNWSVAADDILTVHYSGDSSGQTSNLASLLSILWIGVDN